MTRYNKTGYGSVPASPQLSVSTWYGIFRKKTKIQFHLIWLVYIGFLCFLCCKDQVFPWFSHGFSHGFPMVFNFRNWQTRISLSLHISYSYWYLEHLHVSSSIIICHHLSSTIIIHHWPSTSIYHHLSSYSYGKRPTHRWFYLSLEVMSHSYVKYDLER